MRARNDLVTHPHLDGPLLFRHQQIRTLQRCPHLSKERLTETRIDGLPQPVLEVVEEAQGRRKFSMLNVDPPTHSRLRGQATAAFTLARMEALRPRIQAVTDALLDALADRAEFDLIRDFAFPLPAIVIMELLGVPSADREQLKTWTADQIELLGGLRTAADPLELANRATASGKALRAYAHTLIEAKRLQPQDDFISALVAVQQREDGRLNEEEVVATSTLLLAAGHETTTNLIANGMLALLNGSKIPAGTRLTLLLGAANRDPDHFPDPDRFDITREVNDNFSFGFDRHLCLGAHLARIEGEIAFTTLLRRFPHIELTAAPLAWLPNVAFRALKALPIRVRPA